MVPAGCVWVWLSKHHRLNFKKRPRDCVSVCKREWWAAVCVCVSERVMNFSVCPYVSVCLCVWVHLGCKDGAVNTLGCVLVQVRK